MEDYFNKSRQLIDDDRGLFLLCIQCFEDAIHKKYSKEDLSKRVKISHQMLEDRLRDGRIPLMDGNINLNYLEGIAEIRYSLTVVSELIHYQQAMAEGGKIPSHDIQHLLTVANRCCNDARINADNTGPGVFLVKYTARQYGTAFIIDVTSAQKRLEWIIPPHLRRSTEVKSFFDVEILSLILCQYICQLTCVIIFCGGYSDNTNKSMHSYKFAVQSCP
jgi:hypothetical protein